MTYPNFVVYQFYPYYLTTAQEHIHSKVHVLRSNNCEEISVLKEIKLVSC